jgi:sigma-B regulation protein RsbU (phosphoserine phosphatase)
MSETPHALEASPPKPGAALDGPELSGAFALLAKMTEDFAESQDVEATLVRALESIVDNLGAEAGSIWLVDEEGLTLTCRGSVGPYQITGTRLPVSQGIIGRSVRQNLCQSVFDVTQDSGFTPAVDEQSGFATRSLLCAPVSFTERPLGAIEIVNKSTSDGRFNESDARILRALAAAAALGVANARMAAATAEHQRVLRELELAAEIQRNLLPTPQPDPFPAFGVNLPARTVSGDFYDILPLEDGRIAFCLGDVAGKGMNAALMMAKTASLYRCLTRSIESPGAVLGRLNDELAETASRGMFVTMVAGVYQPESGVACIANAGHEPVLWRRPSGDFEAIPAEAPPLGIDPGIVPGGVFPETRVTLGGGTLYVFSDGLTEACAGDDSPLGAEGVKRLIDELAGRPLAQRVDAIVSEVARFELRDDLTLLAVDDEGDRR